VGKFATGVNNTGGKFAAGVNDAGGKLPPVSTTPATNLPPASLTPVANNGNNIRLQTPESELEKIRNGLNGILWGWWDLIHEKNQKQKIS
jgi:hypothetical protein